MTSTVDYPQTRIYLFALYTSIIQEDSAAFPTVTHRFMKFDTMAARVAERSFRILVINPNTSTHMTEALKPILERLNFQDVHFDYYTAPNETFTLDGRIHEPIASINSAKESAQSALNCTSILSLVPQYDAFLVACYSCHPLVGMILRRIKADAKNRPSERKQYVTGIFEASVTAALSLISAFDFLVPDELEKKQVEQSFGIVTTGSAWKEELGKGVADMLGCSVSSTRFAGVATTGLTAVELHTTAPEEVKRRISEATRRLLLDAPVPAGAICLGCAGMAGMEEAVKAGCVLAYGENGYGVRIVDGVVAGAGQLVTACKAGF